MVNFSTLWRKHFGARCYGRFVLVWLIAVTLSYKVCAPVRAEDSYEELKLIVSSSNDEEVVSKLEPLIGGKFANDAAAQFYYGRALQSLGKLTRAKEAYKKAVELGSGDWPEEYSKRALTLLDSSSHVVAGSATKGGQKGYLGLGMDKNVVVKVLRNSPAALGRLCVGDTVVSADQVSLSNLKTDEVVKRLSGVIGTPVNLIIVRDGKQYSCRLVRAYALQGDGDAVFEDTTDKPNAGGNANARSSTRATSTSAHSTGVTDSARTNILDQSLITVFRQTSETSKAREQILGALSKVPTNVKEELRAWGFKILLTPTILDARPELATEKPRGYDTGGGYDNCPGMFWPEDKTIYVAEKFGTYNQPYRTSHYIVDTTLHECGHAYDSMKSYMSKSEGFLSAYRQDCGRLTNESRRQVSYFTQEQDAGPSELFAELFLFAADPTQRDSRNVVATFPISYQFMKNQIRSNH